MLTEAAKQLLARMEAQSCKPFWEQHDRTRTALLFCPNCHRSSIHMLNDPQDKEAFERSFHARNWRCSCGWRFRLMIHTDDPLNLYEWDIPTLEELHSMPYEQYIRSAEWQETRNQALIRADHHCELCYATEALNVHHKTYERRGYELPNDLIVLCERCHAKFHDILPSEEPGNE